MDGLVPVVHRSGCGAIACYLTRQMHADDVLSDQVVWPDGRVAQSDDGTGTTGDLLVCPSCGNGIVPSDFLIASGHESTRHSWQ